MIEHIFIGVLSFTTKYSEELTMKQLNDALMSGNGSAEIVGIAPSDKYCVVRISYEAVHDSEIPNGPYDPGQTFDDMYPTQDDDTKPTNIIPWGE